MPKIFVFVNGGDGTDWQVGMAIAEDGHMLASHVSSSRGWFRHDMGLTGEWKHEHYRKHYPDGYELVEVPEGEVMTHPGLSAAYVLNQALRREPEENQESPSDANRENQGGA